jgi:hypothetical protein
VLANSKTGHATKPIGQAKHLDPRVAQTVYPAFAIVHLNNARPLRVGAFYSPTTLEGLAPTHEWIGSTTYAWILRTNCR